MSKKQDKTCIVDYCPFCGSDNVEWMGDAYGDEETPFHCHECGEWFGVK